MAKINVKINKLDVAQINNALRTLLRADVANSNSILAEMKSIASRLTTAEQRLLDSEFQTVGVGGGGDISIIDPNPGGISGQGPQGPVGPDGGLGPAGPQGPPGTSPPSTAERVDFSFNTTSPFIVKAMPANSNLIDVELVIDNPFDDSNATLSIGTSGTPGLVLATTDNLPSVSGNYGTWENFEFIFATNLFLFISPGSSTQGSGHIILSTVL